MDIPGTYIYVNQQTNMNIITPSKFYVRKNIRSQIMKEVLLDD